MAQWESETGTHPSVEHLSKLAVATGVTFEWLATGRGPDTSDHTEVDTATVSSDFAQDLVESRVLELLRRLPVKKQLIACKLIEALIDA